MSALKRVGYVLLAVIIVALVVAGLYLLAAIMYVVGIVLGACLAIAGVAYALYKIFNKK